MDTEEFSVFWGERSVPIREGGGLSLRILSAADVLAARREADVFSGGDLGLEDAGGVLCANACLLARALVRGEKPVFESGESLLKALSVSRIESLADQYAVLHRRENPSPMDQTERIDALKKVWSMRLMSALSGVCSNIFALCRPKRAPER